MPAGVPEEVVRVVRQNPIRVMIPTIGSAAANGLPLDPLVTDELQYLDAAGNKLSARVVVLRPPPAPARVHRPR